MTGGHAPRTPLVSRDFCFLSLGPLLRTPTLAFTCFVNNHIPQSYWFFLLHRMRVSLNLMAKFSFFLVCWFFTQIWFFDAPTRVHLFSLPILKGSCVRCQFLLLSVGCLRETEDLHFSVHRLWQRACVCVHYTCMFLTGGDPLRRSLFLARCCCCLHFAVVGDCWLCVCVMDCSKRALVHAVNGFACCTCNDWRCGGAGKRAAFRAAFFTSHVRSWMWRGSDAITQEKWR